MCQAGRAVALAVALAAAAFKANAQDGDVAAGHAFAREACKACHMVEAEEGSSRIIVIGPTFRNIANTPGITATAIRVFLTTSHPKMPSTSSNCSASPATASAPSRNVPAATPRSSSISRGRAPNPLAPRKA